MPITKVLSERKQSHETRKHLFPEIEKIIGRPVVSLFTSFRFPVMIQNQDADMLQAVLSKVDLSKGLALMVSTPGGDPIAAERIINICRTHSGTGDYWAIVPGKAKSAGTMICFGATKIYLAPASELGPVDPQIVMEEAAEKPG